MKRSSAMRKLKQEQFLPITLDEAWEFFATPANLNTVTPPDLVFEITSELPEKMYEGLIITYRIKPMLNIALDWCTEITHIKEKQFFVDEQRKGPYNIWHHEHHFIPALDGRGLQMIDRITYDVGWGPLGTLLDALWIRRQLDTIFNYRAAKIAELFR